MIRHIWVDSEFPSISFANCVQALGTPLVNMGENNLLVTSSSLTWDTIYYLISWNACMTTYISNSKDSLMHHNYTTISDKLSLKQVVSLPNAHLLIKQTILSCEVGPPLKHLTDLTPTKRAKVPRRNLWG